jgi:hypothetical protein
MPLETCHLDENNVYRYLGRCLRVSCPGSKGKKLTKNDARIESGISIGSAHGQPAQRAIRRSRGSRWLGCRIIDLDATRPFAHRPS